MLYTNDSSYIHVRIRFFTMAMAESVTTVVLSDAITNSNS